MTSSFLRRLPLHAGLALAAASCSVLPPGMRHHAEEPVAATAPAPTPPSSSAISSPPQAAPTPPKVYIGTGNFLNPKPPRDLGLTGPEEASLNFEGLDIREVAKVILGDYLKYSYTVDPRVSGIVTFRTVKPIPQSALLPTLEMLLRQNNAAVVQEAGVYKILPISALKGSITPQLGNVDKPVQAGYAVWVVPLKYVSAREMVRLLTPFANDNSLMADDVRNLLIIAGGQREMQHLIDTIDLFDVDWLSGYSVGLFPIRSADVKAVSADLDKLFGPNAQSPLAGIVRVIPIERMNALLVVTTQPKYMETAKSWIERLDQTGGTQGGTRL